MPGRFFFFFFVGPAACFCFVNLRAVASAHLIWPDTENVGREAARLSAIFSRGPTWAKHA